MSKHTPSPWIHWTGYNDEHKLQSHICQQDTALIIARLDVWKDESANEQDANARLIAAAPELLAILEKAKGCFTGHNLLSTATLEERLKTINNFLDWWNNEAIPVIEKAKGKVS